MSCFFTLYASIRERCKILEFIQENLVFHAITLVNNSKLNIDDNTIY